MYGFLLIAGTVVLLCLLVASPKKGLILVWPILWAYPHYYVSQLDLLPLNIGFDDLFLCMFFLIVLVRRNLMGGIPVRVGFSVWHAGIFTLILFAVTLSSYFALPSAALVPEYVKEALKGVINLLLVYALVNCVDDLRDLRTLAFAFGCCVGLGAVIVILQEFFPLAMRAFTSGVQVQYEDMGLIQRPSGAFLNANNAAATMGAAILILVPTLRVRRSHFPRLLRFVVLGILAVAVLATRSRAGFLAIVGSLLWMSVVGRNRIYALACIVLGMTVLAGLPSMREQFFERFTEKTYEGYGGFEGPVAERYDALLHSWRSATAQRVVFGQSMIVDAGMGELYPHSVYLGTPLKYGIAGTIWSVVLVAMLIRRSGTMKRHPEFTISGLGSAIRGCLVAFMLFGIVADFLSAYCLRYTVFLLVVIAHRGTELLSEAAPGRAVRRPAAASSVAGRPFLSVPVGEGGSPLRFR